MLSPRISSGAHNSRYRLGWPLLILASSPGDAALLRAARPTMRAIVVRTGETRGKAVTLVKRVDDNLVEVGDTIACAHCAEILGYTGDQPSPWPSTTARRPRPGRRSSPTPRTTSTHPSSSGSTAARPAGQPYRPAGPRRPHGPRDHARPTDRHRRVERSGRASGTALAHPDSPSHTTMRPDDVVDRALKTLGPHPDQTTPACRATGPSPGSPSTPAAMSVRLQVRDSGLGRAEDRARVDGDDVLPGLRVQRGEQNDVADARAADEDAQAVDRSTVPSTTSTTATSSRTSTTRCTTVLPSGACLTVRLNFSVSRPATTTVASSSASRKAIAAPCRTHPW